MHAAIAMNLNALAGAMIDEDPQRAKALLEEGLGLRAAVAQTQFQSAAEMTQSILLFAQLGDWPNVLALAAPAIGEIHWVTNWFNLIAVANVVARAMVDVDSEAAAVLQGIASHFAHVAQGKTIVAPPPQTATPPGSVPTGGTPGGTGPLASLRRETTALLATALGDETLRELRATGEAMDNDKAVAYALDVVARTRLPGHAST